MNKNNAVFVGNIPYDASEEELREIFGQAGPIGWAGQCLRVLTLMLCPPDAGSPLVLFQWQVSRSVRQNVS